MTPFFNRKPKEQPLPQPTGKVWNMWEHTGWGDSMHFWDFENRRITGHIGGKSLFDPSVHVGDEIRARMDSGKTARFIVTEVEYERDPRDMFWANVSDLDYLQTEQEENKETQS